jgi:hypothetical protein
MTAKRYFWVVKAKALHLSEMRVIMAGRTRKDARAVFMARINSGWDSDNYELKQVFYVD